MQISGKVLSIDFSPYEASIQFTDSNVNDISSITVASSLSTPLSELSVGQTFELDGFLWLGNIKDISESNSTYLRQPKGRNGTEGCGLVTDIIEDDIFVIEVNGVSIRLETENDFNILKGNFVEFTAELHSEI